jgi:hypothetical protein
MELTTKLTTPKARFSYLTVFEPRAISDDKPDKKKYGVTLIFDKATQAGELAQIQELYNAHITALNAQGVQADPHKYGANPFIDCDAYAKWTADSDYDGVYRGKCILRLGATESHPPTVLAVNEQGTYDKVTAVQNRIKSGDYGRAVIGAFTFKSANNNGVSFGLDIVVKDEEGESLGGGSVSVDVGSQMLGITLGDMTGAGLPNGMPQTTPAPLAQPTPAVPPLAQPAPPPLIAPPVAQPAMTEKANGLGYTYEILKNSGWSEDQMRAEGHIL